MGFRWGTLALIALALVCSALALASPALCLQSTGDGSWFWQLPQPQGNELSAVCFSDATTAWAVGGAGTILESVDGGQTWTAHKTPVAALLTDVTFVDADHGWIVGVVAGDDYRGRGLVFSTDDGGKTWRQLPSAVGHYPAAASFVDPQHGWIADWDGVYRTTDGGASWTRQRTGGWLSDLEFTDTMHGWAADGNGGLLRTTDGGAHWQRLPAWKGRTVQSITFVDAQHGWVTEDRYHDGDAVFATSDGGVHWRRQLTSSHELIQAVFVDSSHGLAYARRGDWEHGYACVTDDGGATWEEHRFSADPGWASVALSSSGAAVIVGQGILASSDFGQSWTNRQSGRADGAERLQFVDDKTGWAVSGSRVLLHTQDGVSWSPQLQLTSSSIAAFRFVSATDGWLASRTGDVYRSSDGGETWARVARLAGWQIGALSFADSSHGWLVGRPRGASSWRVLTSTDSGLTWDEQARVALDMWQSPQVCVLDAQRVWVVAGQSVLRTSDGGVVWSRSKTPGDVGCLDFVDATHGWIGVSVGCTPEAVNGVYATHDGGATWQPQGSGSPLRYSDVNGIAFINALEGWAVGGPRGGSILGPELTNVAFHTTDGGATWQQIEMGLYDYATSVAAVDSGHVWVATYDGILSTVDTDADIAPPTTLDDGDGLWHNGDVTLTFSAADVGGSGLARTEYRIDGEGPWQVLPATELLLPVGAAGLPDGSHRVTYRSTDLAGNVEGVRGCTVKLDTVSPRPSASWAAAVARGGEAKIFTLVRDPLPCASRLKQVIEIRTRDGRLLKSIRRTAVRANAKVTTSFRCLLPRGSYRFCVYATDAAGNTQSRVASNLLTVR